MKNTMRSIIIYIVVFVLCSTGAFAEGVINVVEFAVNGKVICKDQYIYTENDEILVPIRCLYMSGYDIEQEVDSIVIRKGFVCVKYFINSNSAIINDEIKILNVVPQIIGNRLYIPIKSLENALNNEIEWDSCNGVLNIIENSLSEDDKLDLDEEVAAKKFARDFCKVNFRFLERATISGDECYVFAQYEDGSNIVAVDRKCKKIYSVVLDNCMYRYATVIYSV